ncbi:hypothetical protein GCM10011399_17400 [Subtercola lobariae]|uniref:Uncharacterized protein n=2 Tax=Subtercola lobariae TaxID=1588641 RepID=A0A917EW02_9MICO|nr:hypothetical protein GCM10011399_17400 [Subtercola lobariae]
MNARIRSARSDSRITIVIAAAIALVLVVSAVVGWAVNSDRPVAAAPPDYSAQASAVASVVQSAMTSQNLASVIVRVTRGNDVVTEQAFGDSMTGVTRSP